MTAENHMGPLQTSYDQIAEEYAARIYHELDHKPLDRALLDCFAELVRDRGTVGDIGCGPGHVGRYLHDAGITVTGVDLSREMVGHASRLNPMMTFEPGNMLDLDVLDGSWAGIVAFYSIIHLPPAALSEACTEFYRVLAPDGLLLVAFHEGEKQVHLDDWWGHAVDVDTYFRDRVSVEEPLRHAGFTIDAFVEREPHEDVEYPSRRCYILARKSVTHGRSLQESG